METFRHVWIVDVDQAAFAGLQNWVDHVDITLNMFSSNARRSHKQKDVRNTLPDRHDEPFV